MFRSIHFKAFAVWGIYTITTKGSFITGVSKWLPGLDAYFLNIFFSVLFGCLFLYFFSHEDFFKFAKEIEKKNSKKEKEWEARFLHFSKLTSVVIIGILSGPLVGALAVRFLLPKYQYKYWVVAFSSALSATIWLAAARGIIRFPL